MEKELHVTLTKCRNGLPLAVVHNLPGEGAEMRPEVMRALAVALYRAAMDCDEKPKGLWGVLPAKRSYPVEAASSTSVFSSSDLDEMRARRTAQRAHRLEQSIARSLGR